MHILIGLYLLAAVYFFYQKIGSSLGAKICACAIWPILLIAAFGAALGMTSCKGFIGLFWSQESIPNITERDIGDLVEIYELLISDGHAPKECIRRMALFDRTSLPETWAPETWAVDLTS